MKRFMFITSEGNTIAPNESYEVSNMQVLDVVDNVETKEEAFNKLFRDNQWIIGAGYNKDEIQCYELA